MATNGKTRSSHNRGWTMVELVIVLLVLSVLLSLAYPFYSGQIIKARRADGHALLYGAALREQQFFSSNNSYTATIGDGGLGISSSSQEGNYTLSITATTTTYTLTATRDSTQTDDTWCGDLTLTHLGAKGNANASWSADKCW